jgi:two-component system, chemotaxis family, chemotaxis protein CheY
MAKRILIVDDSSTVRQQVGLTLTGAGYDVLEASDGQDGAEQIDKNELALVICDVNMPRMNGIEMLTKIKRTDGTPRPPVIMLTTEGQPALIEKAKAAGARGWIIKPFKPDMLIAAVRKIAGAS